MKKAIVTGASGFIGSSLVKELLMNDYKVYAVVRDRDEFLAKFIPDEQLSVLSFDMDSYSQLTHCRELLGADLLFHFAWSGVSDIYSQEYAAQISNVRYSCDLMTSAVKLGVTRFVFAGSIMEFEQKKAFEQGYYGLTMRGLYPIAKKTARDMLQVIANNSAIEYIPVTISNVFGQGDNSRRFINSLIVSLLKNQRMELTSCEQLYNFIYIEDAVRAIRMVGERGTNNRSYFIGSGLVQPLKYYVESIYRIIKPTSSIEFGGREHRGVSLEYNEFDRDSILSDCGFRTQIDFEEGVSRTVEWIREHLDRYN